MNNAWLGVQFTFHGLGLEKVVLQPLDPLDIGMALNDFTTILDHDTTGQLRVLRQRRSGLVANVAANVHKNETVMSTNHIVVKRHYIHTVEVYVELHGSLKVLQGMGPLHEPGVDLKLGAKGLLECTALRLVLISCLLEELGQSVEGRVADFVEESDGIINAWIGKDVRLLAGDVLVRCCLSDQATSNHVAHDATDEQRVCHVGLCELCRRQRYFTFRKGLEDSKVPADVDKRLSTLVRELRQYILYLKGHKRCCHLLGFN